uniref:uncharacterized protein LOC122602819 isoform X2 n=1 Tax=Erigeron canadensis TaxID=72917 RepID=UPI001CB98DF9|nr:uncharacterized protein LOC122602819 isoform X2 [Erigeron canadensis]
MGISPEVRNLVYHFVVLGIILLGAALGYWLVRRYAISEDDEVNVGVAQFVKWSMLVVAVTCIFLSTKDNLLAMVAVGSCLAIYYVISYMKWRHHQDLSYIGMHNLRARSKQTSPKQGHAEFLSKSKMNSPLRSPYSRLVNSFRWFNSPVKDDS